MSALNSSVRYGLARPSGIVTGLLISLLLHAMLIYGYRLGWTPRPPAYAPPETMTVWLRPPPPRELPPPPPPLAARPEQSPPVPPKPRKKPADSTTAPARPPATMTLVTPAAPPAPSSPQPQPELDKAARGAPADPFAEPARPASGKFDIEAARRTARKVANERDPAKAGTALGQLPEQPLASETPLARSMSKAARADCKDGLPGGLLAPLLLLMDKKDSGCKW